MLNNTLKATKIQAAIDSHQDLSGPISSHQEPSAAIRSYQDLSEAIRTYQDLSAAIVSHQELSGAIGSHQELSRPIRTYQELSAAIGSHQELSRSIRNYQEEAVKIKKLINKKTDMRLKKMIQMKKLWLNKEGVVELKMERIMNKNKTLWMALGSPLRLENRLTLFGLSRICAYLCKYAYERVEKT